MFSLQPSPLGEDPSEHEWLLRQALIRAVIEHLAAYLSSWPDGADRWKTNVFRTPRRGAAQGREMASRGVGKTCWKVWVFI